MVKFSSSQILTVLRQYKAANEEHMPRMVERIQPLEIDAKRSALQFRFLKNTYYLLIDNTIDDTAEDILDTLRLAGVTTELDILRNPYEETLAYGIPFKGKDVYLVVEKATSKRLDIWLAERYPEHSRSTWQKHIKAGHIRINGEVVTSSKAPVAHNDEVATEVPERGDFSEVALPIIYEDDNVIVINKPAGILTHSKGALNDEFTVAEFFKRYTTYNSDTNRPGIVHRLDRDTSGVMIGARNEETAQLLQKQFAARKAKKTYVAVLNGHPKEPKARIDLPIGRNPNAPSTFRVDAKGKTAQTNYEVVAQTDKHSLVYLTPETGRTHQLRVHVAYINTPIVGDRVYGKPADRMYLHAYKLEVTIPKSERRVFEAPIPEEFVSEFSHE